MFNSFKTIVTETAHFINGHTGIISSIVLSISMSRFNIKNTRLDPRVGFVRGHFVGSSTTSGSCSTQQGLRGA